MENDKKDEKGRLIEFYSNRNILITEMKICFYKKSG